MNVVYVTAALFCIGLYGVLTRRELIAVLASLELMMGAANIQLVAYAASSGEGALHAAGQGLGLVVLALAAAEAAVGLAILVTMSRRWKLARVEELTEVQG